jgi:hypothetical protein
MSARHLAAGDAPSSIPRIPSHPRHRAETAVSTSPTVTGNPARSLELLSSIERAEGAAVPPNAAAPTLIRGYGIAVPAPRPATRHLNARSNA